MAEQRLSQVVAVEKQVKARVNSEGATLHKTNQKADLFNGMTRIYEKKDEEGEDLPEETKLVQERAEETLRQFLEMWSELVDVTVTKDQGNALVTQEVKVDGKVLVEAPPTFLIWMEKQLDDLKTFIKELPTLDPSREWAWDANRNLYSTKPTRTARHKKTPRVIRKAEATEHHPAQTEIVMEDVLVGYWATTYLSGGVSAQQRKEMLDRIENLRKAFKTAREEANSRKVPRKEDVGRSVCEYILGKS